MIGSPSTTVYPRVHGGTLALFGASLATTGLSPRARGNQYQFAECAKCRGSIPACTGEPQLAKCLHVVLWVYPRVHGGTATRLTRVKSGFGLSPRARGNRIYLVRVAHANRSIPACTGEPLRRLPVGCRTSVYPRVHGGTPAGSSDTTPGHGLSPRARGNLVLLIIGMFN